MMHEQSPAPRILLVDDDSQLRARLTEALAKSGYEVSELADGEAALEAVKRIRPKTMSRMASSPCGVGACWPRRRSFGIGSNRRGQPSNGWCATR